MFVLAVGHPGRRVASRNATPTRQTSQSSSRGRRANKRQPVISDKFAAFFSLAGLGTVAMTSGSAMSATPTTAVIVPSNSANVASGDSLSVTQLSLISRARAASRSEVRLSKSDAAALNAAATAPNESATSASQTLSANDRMQLRAFAADSNQLNQIVQDTEEQAAQAVADALAAKAAAAKAAAKAAQAVAKAAESNGNTTYPTDVSRPGRAYGAPAPSQAQLDGRVSPIVGGYQLSARFGQRGGIWSSGWHTGLDFVVPTGTQIRSASAGVIINAGWSGAYGNRIEIATADGYIVTYNHLSKIYQSSGTVSAGDVIGKSGSTGNTTGPHLHFEVLYNDRFVNPAVWLWGASR